MLDPRIVQLLEQAVNSSSKLALVLLLDERGRFAATPRQLALRLGRDPWSIETAISELVQDGILAVRDGQVVYRPQPELVPALQALRVAYDDPYRRDAITGLVRDLQRYAPYRDELLSRHVTVNAL